MSGPAQVAHLFRHEILRVRWLLAALGLMLGAMITIELVEPFELMFHGSLLWLAVNVLIALILAVAVQADPPRGARATWRTLPISGWAVVASKAHLGLFLIAVFLGMMALPWLWSSALSWPHFVRPAGGMGAWLALVVVLAIVTGNLRRFALTAIVVSVGWSAISFSGHSDRGESSPLEFNDPETRPLPAQLQLGIERFQPAPLYDPGRRLFNLDVDGRGTGLGYVLVDPRVVIRLASGDTVTGWGENRVSPLHTPALPVGDPVHWLGPSRPEQPAYLTVTLESLGPIVRPGPGRTSVGPPDHEGRLVAHVEGLRPATIGRIPLDQEKLTTPGRQIQVLAYSITDGELDIQVGLREIRGAVSPLHLGFEVGFARRGALAWALHNPERNEAVALVARSRSSSSGPMGEIRTLALQPAQSEMSWWKRGSQPDTFPLPLPDAVDRHWLGQAELVVFEWVPEGIHELRLHWDAQVADPAPPPAPGT
jgi:hypothetical protein